MPPSGLCRCRRLSRALVGLVALVVVVVLAVILRGRLRAPAPVPEPPRAPVPEPPRRPTATRESDKHHGNRHHGSRNHGSVQSSLASEPSGDVPTYWTNQDINAAFDEKYTVNEEFQQQLQALLESTWKHKKTRDRKGDLPKRLKLFRAQRIECRDMWAKYVAGRARVKDTRGRCTPVNELDHDHEHGHVRTQQNLDPKYQDRLDESINEHYLFHGTSPQGAMGITHDGFKLSYAGSSVGTMFGAGAYFAEASSKADEYAKSGEMVFEDVYALLLCRVVTGEMFRVTKAEPEKIDAAIGSGRYDAVLGDREASVGTYREFVVFQEDVIYPEYLILYSREF